MPKQRRHNRIPKSLVTVTGFSKSLALVIILIFVLFAFYLGMEYQKEMSQAGLDVTPTPIQSGHIQNPGY